jgi:hypothetical protein
VPEGRGIGYGASGRRDGPFTASAAAPGEPHILRRAMHRRAVTDKGHERRTPLLGTRGKKVGGSTHASPKARRPRTLGSPRRLRAMSSSSSSSARLETAKLPSP